MSTRWWLVVWIPLLFPSFAFAQDFRLDGEITVDFRLPEQYQSATIDTLGDPEMEQRTEFLGSVLFKGISADFENNVYGRMRLHGSAGIIASQTNELKLSNYSGYQGHKITVDLNHDINLRVR